MKIVLSLSAMLAGALSVSAASGSVNASAFGWNPVNATKCLQSAIDSGAKKVAIDRQSGDKNVVLKLI